MAVGGEDLWTVAHLCLRDSSRWKEQALRNEFPILTAGCGNGVVSFVRVWLDYTESPVGVDMVSGSSSTKITYAQSNGHTELNSSWLGRLDEQLAAAIREVKLPYRTDIDGAETVASGSAGLAAKIWLPSVIEVAYGTNYMSNVYSFYVEEGAKFSYWKDVDPDQYDLWQCWDADGNEQGWGTRTPNRQTRGTEAAYFNEVRQTGFCYNSKTDQALVWPCMVLPDEVMVDGDNYVQVGKIMHCRRDGAWMEGTCSVKVDGAWKELAQQAVKVGGVWKE